MPSLSALFRPTINRIMTLTARAMFALVATLAYAKVPQAEAYGTAFIEC